MEQVEPDCGSTVNQVIFTGDECVLYIELISNNLWLASVVCLQLPHDNHVLILGLVIK